jgi:hypothetical protein
MADPCKPHPETGSRPARGVFAARTIDHAAQQCLNPIVLPIPKRMPRAAFFLRPNPLPAPSGA